MSIGFIIGMMIGMAVGLVFGLFKLIIMLSCEISKIAAQSVVNEVVKRAAEVQPSFKVKRV